ncbi:GIY-YIG nuclease family protein [Aestuariibaculum sp. M13]|uniref:GIY-YIG nuclease family protein n=1 Tax=unclassified Aestuariibaculum TaxID=2646735 RepID=UPI002159D797|nr:MULTISPECIES: GIY-YIG nuclease family protein [unclassified Aestuariibaculum]MCR8666500.1 GIY-YIG nuclease family protein [Aestuariibaculum sp. M13]WMI65979.1 GIY-YIG nuclease family protein [Aestuariibaculum sp. YM273]
MDVYYVYILTNKNHTVLYVGRTKQLNIRLKQHRNNSQKTFTGRYNVHKLVYFETTKYVNNAIKREKQIKKWNRQWKINLINGLNPDWKDLSEYV